MWPWEHLAFGYLTYALVARVSGIGRPTQGAALTIALATQFPDLVDKPISWVFHFVAGGRTFGHSLVFGLPLVVIL